VDDETQVRGDGDAGSITTSVELNQSSDRRGRA
jgi:hypothetical protein